MLRGQLHHALRVIPQWPSRNGPRLGESAAASGKSNVAIPESHGPSFPERETLANSAVGPHIEPRGTTHCIGCPVIAPM